MSVVLLTILAVVLASPAQLLPPPGDGEIRTVYWDLRNETETWLTLVPASATGAAAPLMTFTCRFPGRRPSSAADEVEVRAYAGTFWAPRADLVIVLDGNEVLDLSPGATGLIQGTPSDFSTGTITLETLDRIAASRRIAGSALGFPFELTESQRLAVGEFLSRVAHPPQ